MSVGTRLHVRPTPGQRTEQEPEERSIPGQRPRNAQAPSPLVEPDHTLPPGHLHEHVPERPIRPSGLVRLQSGPDDLVRVRDGRGDGLGRRREEDGRERARSGLA